MMHGQRNIKLCDAKQVHHYKNIKLKLYKNNTAIWFNKACKGISYFSNTRPLTSLQSDSTICCMYTIVSSWRWAIEARNMSVLTLAAYRQPTRNSYREWQYHMLHVYNCILLKMSTWGSKHVEENSILWICNNLYLLYLICICCTLCVFVVLCVYCYSYFGCRTAG